MDALNDTKRHVLPNFSLLKNNFILELCYTVYSVLGIWVQNFYCLNSLVYFESLVYFVVPPPTFDFNKIVSIYRLCEFFLYFFFHRNPSKNFYHQF